MKFSRRVFNKHLNIFIILFFEFFGTALFGYVNINLINLAKDSDNPVDKEIYVSIDFALSMFMCISFGRQFSGGLYNPAVALFRMFRKTDRYPPKVGLLYILTQFSGSVFGCCLAFWVNDLKKTTITELLPVHTQLQMFYVEAFGTCVLTLMVQTVSEKKMTFIEHNREFYICLPLFYLITRQYCSISNGINPALGFGFELSYCIFTGHWDIMKMAYILVIGPMVGSLLSVFLFEFLLKPLYPIKRGELIKKMQELRESREKQEREAQKELKPLKVRLEELNMEHRNSLNGIINHQEEDFVYQDFDDDYTMIADEDLNDEIVSVDDDEERYIGHEEYSFRGDNMPQSSQNKSNPKSSIGSKSNATFRVMGNFKY